MRKWNFTPGKLLVVLLMLVTVFGNIYAKYATTQTVNGALKVTANLGTIAMDTGAITEKIIPGVDIEVKHEVKITEKSSIPAYVYLVAETNAGEASKLSFVPSNAWMKIQSTVSNGKTTTVYVYANGTTPVSVDHDVTIPVEGVLQVSQHVNVSDLSEVELNFSAKMYQTAAGNDAMEIYTNCNTQS